MNSKITTQVSGVLFDKTLDECQEVLDAFLGVGSCAHFRLVRRILGRLLEYLSAFLYEMIGRKAQGQ